MTRTKVLLGILLLVAAAFGCSTLIERRPDTYDAVIQLHDYEQGRFYCSATVVSKNYAITAGHCIQGETPIKIFDKNAVDTGVVATPVRASSQMDYAVLSGDFGKFKFIKAELDVKQILKSFNEGNLIACGYPMAGSLICLPVKDANQYIFYFRASGALYPGMSGGPVIDKNTGRLIGVNSAVYENGVLLAPIINLLFGLTL